MSKIANKGQLVHTIVHSLNNNKLIEKMRTWGLTLKQGQLRNYGLASAFVYCLTSRLRWLLVLPLCPINMNNFACINVSSDHLKWRPMPNKKCGNLRYAITYVIWANQKNESFEYHWLCALAMFDVTSFPAILSGIQRHFKFCRYNNCCKMRNVCAVQILWKKFNFLRFGWSYMWTFIILVGLCYFIFITYCWKTITSYFTAPSRTMSRTTRDHSPADWTDWRGAAERKTTQSCQWSASDRLSVTLRNAKCIQNNLSRLQKKHMFC